MSISGIRIEPSLELYGRRLSFAGGESLWIKKPHSTIPGSKLTKVRTRRRDKPWKGNPEKEQRPGTKKSDPDRWQKTNTH